MTNTIGSAEHRGDGMLVWRSIPRFDGFGSGQTALAERTQMLADILINSMCQMFLNMVIDVIFGHVVGQVRSEIRAEVSGTGAFSLRDV